MSFEVSRYQYDPNGRVRDAMAHIWTALVPEPRAALDAHFGGCRLTSRYHARYLAYMIRQAVNGTTLMLYEPESTLYAAHTAMRLHSTPLRLFRSK